MTRTGLFRLFIALVLLPLLTSARAQAPSAATTIAPDPSAAVAPTLHTLFDRAWERSVPGRAAAARRSEAAASRAVADSLLAGSPSVAIAERNDRYNRDRGQRERELELALPLWLPGQRDARAALASGDAEESEAQFAAARLAVAGELRAALWALAAEESEMRVAQERLDTMQKIEADVARREAAGDLAHTDLLLARQEVLTARIAATDAETRRIAAAGRLRVLTGGDTVPADADEAITTPQPAQLHPRLRQAAAVAKRARAALSLAEEDRREPPELSLGVQQSREDYAAPSRNSLRIGIRIPFATESRNAPKIAAANTVLAQAEAEQLRVEAEVAVELARTEAALAAAKLSDALSAERAAAAGERERLLARAFELGELPLPELLRAQAAAREGRLDAVRARAAHALAKALYNQARGVLP